MPDIDIDRRHRILIAAAVAAVAGPHAEIREITVAGWSQLKPGRKQKFRTAAPKTTHVNVRTARREKVREAANLA